MKKIVIIISSNLPGAGKTTISKYISKKLNLIYYSSGNLVRYIFKSLNLPSRGLSFSKLQDEVSNFKINNVKKIIKKWLLYNDIKIKIPKEEDFDKLIDKITLEIIKKGNCVVDSWLAPYVVNNKIIGLPYLKLNKDYILIKVLLKVNLENSILRISKRDKIKDSSLAKKSIKLRVNKTFNRISKIYNINLRATKIKYDLVIDTNNYTKNEVKNIVLKKLKELIF